jgi:hypothetical protein
MAHRLVELGADSERPVGLRCLDDRRLPTRVVGAIGQKFKDLLGGTIDIYLM